MDGLNSWGKTKDLTIIGLGNSTLDDTATEVLAAHGRTVSGDAEPEKGYFYRSGPWFEFTEARRSRARSRGGHELYREIRGLQRNRSRDYYTANDFHHKPSDEVKPDWDLSGAVDDLRVLLEVGYKVAQDPKIPEWKDGTEFKATRDNMMKYL